MVLRGELRMRRMGLALGVAGLAAVMFVVGGVGLIRRVEPEAPSAAHATGPALSSKPVVGSATLTGIIANLQDRLRAAPNDRRSFADLGLAYVQQARVTADPSFYSKAEGALTRSLGLNGSGNFVALTGMASLAAARHDFAAALAWGEKAVAANPDSADARAVLGDAQLELGLYDQAFRTYQTMIDLRPDLSTYARVSYAWELQGDFDNAVRAMDLALDAAATPADAAWASNQLGELNWNHGRLAESERWYRRAIATDQTFVPSFAGLARIEAARGRIDRAIESLRRVVQRFPSPELVIALADLYTTSGRPEEAARQHALVRAQERLLHASGVNVDLEIALFDVDHGVDLANGLGAARREWARRKSIHVADALAWILHANGQHEEALRYANRALRLGTRNALFLFHRGMIERAMGKRLAARRDLASALAINPHFSILWSKRAEEVLAGLGGAP